MSNTFLGFVEPDGRLTLDFPAVFKKYVAAKFKGEEIELEVRKRRTKRSDKQNHAFHAMIAPWARDEGHHIEDLKDACLGAVFGYREVTSPITGEVGQVLAEPHSSTLNTQQFAELMERTVELAAGCGVLLELPDEFKRRKADEARARRKQAA